MWSDKYVEGVDGDGIPFHDHGRDWNGVDCYGLIYLVYKEELKVELPTYTEVYSDARDREDVVAALNKTRIMDTGFARVHLPTMFDCLLLSIAGGYAHCGVMVNEREFLHITEGIRVCVENSQSPAWKPNIVGFYRHRTARDNLRRGLAQPLLV